VPAPHTRGFHPWHDLPTGPEPPLRGTAVIEIPTNERKILAVSLRDPYSEGINDLPDLQQHHLREVEHFFQVYKDLEGTGTETRGFEDAAAARAEIRRAMAAYQAHIHDRSPSRRPRISQRP
jgi:hypothetical protein